MAPASTSGETAPAPRVSVITIFLDAGRYLDAAIQSVVDQSLHGWELVLVDDGSSDASSAIARRWAALRPGQVRYVEHAGHANLGMSASRNRGLREARGDYVAFLDADDVYLPDRLARHVSILDAMPEVDLVQSDQVYWYCWQDKSGAEHEQECIRPPLFVGDALIRPPAGLLSLFGVPDAFTAPCSITVRRPVALELGGFEDSFRSLYEDQVFMTKVYAHRTTYALQAYLAKYRLHAGGSVASLAAKVRGGEGEFFEAGRRLRQWQAEYLGRIPGLDPLVFELLEDHAARLRQPRQTRLQAMKILGRQLAHRASRRCLPLPAYRRLLQRRQQWSADRSKQQHARLCGRLAAARLSRAMEV